MIASRALAQVAFLSWRRRRGVLAVILSALLCCYRDPWQIVAREAEPVDGQVEEAGGAADAPTPSGEEAAPPFTGSDTAPAWGTYVAARYGDIPCPVPSAQVLMVDTTDDALDAAPSALTSNDPALVGAQLSLPEALWIATNAPPKIIRFLADAFSPSAPGVITIGAEGVTTTSVPWASEMAQACIDGRDRGVIIQWPAGASNALLWSISADSLQIGLTLLRAPSELVVQSRGQVAACRLQTDGYGVFDGDRPWTVEAGDDARIGPGNVIANQHYGVRVFGLGARIWGNDIDYDPLTRRAVATGMAFDLRGGALIEDNVIAGPFGSNMASDITVRGNYFGVDRSGLALPAPRYGFGVDGGVTTFGPGNVIRNVDTAVSIADFWGAGAGMSVLLTRNIISGNGAGIVGSPVASPNIGAASASAVNGTCPFDGTVEVFADKGDQGESYLGSVACSASLAWTLAASATVTGAIPSGRNVTATVTDSAGRTSGFSAPYPVP